MLRLPFEILTHIFSYLIKPDLLQCQLTSESWYEASVELLYSKVTINTGPKSFRFVRTISNSSRLGGYVRIINTESLFKMNHDYGLWDEHGLLSTLIQQCPNLLQLHSWDQDFSFWTQIIDTATQGRLCRLQSLPRPKSINLEYYINTVLLFKSSLTSLLVQDEWFSFGLDLNRLRSFKTLLDQIKEFKNLQHIEIRCQSDKKLTCFDTLIEDCPNLKKLHISLCPSGEQRTLLEPEMAINPRPDIREFRCNWRTIDTERQLEYFRRKFSNLQRLSILFSSKRKINEVTTYCSCNAVIEFLHYVISIPKFKVHLLLRNQDLAAVWSSLINTNDRFRDVTIDYYFLLQYSDEVNLYIETKSSKIYFVLTENDFELPHIRFFSEMGSMVRSLTLENMEDFVLSVNQRTRLYTTANSVDWIFQIIQLCPSLEELTISIPSDEILSSYQTFQLTQVKKLSVINMTDSLESIRLLQYMSLNLPNISQLHLSYSRYQHKISGAVTVFMPYTWLDLFTWTNVPPRYKNNNSFEVYIRLNTDKGLNFYLGNKSGLFAVNEQRYNTVELFKFDITCRSLKELVVIDTEKSPSNKLKFVL